MFRKKPQDKTTSNTDAAISEAVRQDMKTKQLKKANSNNDGSAPISEEDHAAVMAALGMPGYK